MNGTAKYLSDLRVGSVVRDGRTVYKILAKSPGAIYVEKRAMVKEFDYSVMPAKEIEVERTTKLHIAPTARLSDFKGGDNRTGPCANSHFNLSRPCPECGVKRGDE